MKEKPIENKAELKKIIEESSESAKQYLPKLYEGLKEVINLFDEGKDEEAVLLFATAIEGLEWFSVFQRASDVVYPSLHSEGTIKLEEVLKELLNAWETHNFLLMSELLEFELLPLLEKSITILNTDCISKH